MLQRMGHAVTIARGSTLALDATVVAHATWWIVTLGS